MKVSKVCDKNVEGCFVKNLKYSIFGLNGEFDKDPLIAVVLSDGASFQFSNMHIGGLFIDVDGPNKGKNIFGNDIYFLPMNENSNLDLTILTNDYASAGHPINEISAYFLFVTLEWVLRYGNLDYLKVDSDGICPDGKTVLTWDQQTSCK